MRILTWNLAWATRSTRAGEEIVRRILDARPEVAVFTELTTSLVEKLGGHVVLAAADYGYGIRPDRRKVAIWSVHPLANTDTIGSPELPSGRFVKADVKGLRIVGVCIPWSDAHVRSGRRDRNRWQDHLTYVGVLRRLARNYRTRTVIAGDFNQRRPRHGQPLHVFEELDGALRHLSWVTSGQIGPASELSIDHVVTSTDIQAKDLQCISNRAGDLRLSDHFAVHCEVTHAA